ncbi:MAG: FecR domain-containing protein [Treponema sp.]|nr:FecR domain-containing protein [Treponema sp.]
MKKIVKLILSVLLLSLFSASVWALDAKITQVSGKVEIQTDGATWKAATPNMVLKKGYIISTGFKSSATIVIDGATVKLDAMTRMTVEKLASNSSKTQTNLYLNNGKVSADVKKTSGKKVDFKVSSAASTASVRGTSFTFSADGTITTIEGLVSKGPGKMAAEIKSDDADEFLPEDGESTATTETKDVSGAREIPVSAGQTSTTDQLSGIHATPQEEDSKRKISARGHGTESIADREQGTSLSPEKEAAPEISIPETKTGTVKLTIIFSN